jgi:hypothetical protein
MVTSLELSKKLWEKGLRFKSEKYHCQSPDGEWIVLPIPDLPNAGNYWENVSAISAYSTDELLTVMPYMIYEDSDNFNLLIRKSPKDYVIRYDSKYRAINRDNKILVEGLGELCLWLLDNGYKFDTAKKMIVKP